jgi:Tfp pilus tip-associated adhesin PilY1
VLTGVEKWAFIPHNLLPKLKNMWVTDPATGARYFARDVYCDGSPVVADVYTNDEWRTVLVCGQGPGMGSTIGGGHNYYFALDVTDVENPQPLWEMTHYRMGETWSVPAIGRVTKNGQAAWVGFVGSGYDNISGSGRQGNRFYAFDVADGSIFRSYNTGEVNTRRRPGWNRNIANTIPGSPSIIDLDNDGAADRVYFADLDGRLYKIDTSVEYLSADPWDLEEIYEDSRNFPIITKPAVWQDPASAESMPHVYFGTGGDDNAPDDQYYSFIGVIDDPSATRQSERVEWYLGDSNVLNLSEDKAVGTLTVGEKVWADPQIANSVVYFSTLTGDIETVDPCESLSGIGRLYGRYVKAVAGSPVGSTAFRGASGTMENLGLEIKTRAAVTLGEKEKVGGIYKQDVYIQEFDSTIQKLSQPTGSALRIRSWREIYHIKK